MIFLLLFILLFPLVKTCHKSYLRQIKSAAVTFSMLLRAFYPKGGTLSRVFPKTREKKSGDHERRIKKVLDFKKPADLFEQNLIFCCTYFDNSP